MAYLQVKDVLQRAEDLRKFVRDYEQRRRTQAKDDYLEGLLKELSEHEERLRKQLSEFEDEADARLLETWLQFPGVERLEEAMVELAAVDGCDDEVILQNLIEANEALLECYDQAKAQTKAPALTELLEQLRDLQDHHLRQVARSVSEYEQP